MKLVFCVCMCFHVFVNWSPYEKSMKEGTNHTDNDTYLMSKQWFLLGSIRCLFMNNMCNQYSRHSQQIRRLRVRFPSKSSCNRWTHLFCMLSACFGTRPYFQDTRPCKPSSSFSSLKEAPPTSHCWLRFLFKGIHRRTTGLWMEAWRAGFAAVCRYWTLNLCHYQINNQFLSSDLLLLKVCSPCWEITEKSRLWSRVVFPRFYIWPHLKAVETGPACLRAAKTEVVFKYKRSDFDSVK